MLKLFDAETDISISLSEGEAGCVAVAARDLQKDLRRLSGRGAGFEITPDTQGVCIRIETDGKGAAEGFSVSVGEGGAVIKGGGALGTVYGIYAFCERALGVDPMHLITGFFPSEREAFYAGDAAFSDYPKGPRFRGWFINDEDLLTDFRPGGGIRRIDYPFYGNVMHPEVLEIVLETALRLGINLIIPSSFVDIMNPAEEELVRAVCRRGLYITQHHVEPLGVSYFGAANYIREHKLGGDVSYIRNREVMELIWTKYAEKWAAYGDRVIWQMGLRGRGDRPVWQSDKNVPASDAERGAIISGAIETQRRIIAEATGGADFCSTVTLWMEGAELYDKGALAIPGDTIVVFSDIGLNLMFGDDFYNVKRTPEHSYGLYYHAAFWAAGPHLAEGCNPKKMLFCYGDAAQRDSLSYSILNVSNLREVHFSAKINAGLVWAPGEFRLDEFLKREFTRLYGCAAAKFEKGFWDYFDAFADLGDEELKRMCAAYSFHYRDYGGLPFINYAANDGSIRQFGLAALEGRIPAREVVTQLKNSAAKFEALLGYWRALEKDVPADSLDYFRQFPLLQTKYLLLLTRWCLDCAEAAANPQGAAKAQSAAAHLKEILSARAICERGRWRGWYTGDKKMNIQNMMDKRG